MVRERRLEAELSQEALAQAARFHPIYASPLERGLRAPNLPAVQRLARALGTSMASLVAEAEQP